MLETWRNRISRYTAEQLSEPRGVWGRVTGAVMNAVNAEINRQSIQLLTVAPQSHVLEIGFGGGSTLPLLLQLAATGRVAGIERSETMLESARTANISALKASRLELVAGDASTLPWSNSSFDRVLTVNSIYFWDAPIRVLTEIRRVLKPQGKLVLAYRPKPLMERLPVTTHGFRLYSDDSTLTLLYAAGLEVVEMKFGGRNGQEHTCVVATPL